MTDPNPATIYKILSRSEWLAAQELGRFCGSAVDLADGFLHFSTTEQVRETAAKHFAGRLDCWLLGIERAALDARCPGQLVFEPSRGGALFPHLYGDLPTDLVSWAEELPWEEGVGHRFPAALS